MRRVDPGADTVSLDPGTTATEVSGEPRPAEVAPLAPGDRIDRYTIVRCIDRGGMGVVYEAEDESLRRRVALKLLLDGPARSATTAARLVQEARTAAGLSHPNVVGIYEVGTAAIGPFIAMEYVEGMSLRRWLAAAPRSWQEIVAVFREAAAGIAAAHDANIVHRDIKPDNILVGDDRVRVADFGLARFALEDEPPPDPTSPSGDDRLTQRGAVIGTPRYMSPEQLAGRDADARSDQFGFCASLAEALADIRGVPAWLRAVAERGTQPDPAARYPSMTALLAALARDRRPRARSLAVGGTLVIGCAIAGVVVLRADEVPPCSGAEAQLAGIWDPAVKARIGGSIAALDLRFAVPSWRHTEARLDRYAGEWTAMHTAACKATHVDRSQSEAMLDRRMACLDRRKRAMSAIVSSLDDLDPRAIETAPLAADRLPQIAECGDLVALARSPAPQPAQLQIDEDLIAARLHLVGDRLSEARDAAQRALDGARAAADRERIAEALIALGDIGLSSNSTLALEHLNEAQEIASELGATAAQIRAWDLIGEAYMRLGKIDESLKVYELAFAALAEAPDRLLESQLLRARGAVRSRSGKYEDAQRDFERALALAIEVLGPDAEPLSSIYNALSIVLREQGHYEDALALARRRLELTNKLGEGHPEAARARRAVGDMLIEVGRYDEAEAELLGALAALRDSQGPRSDKVGFAELSIGVLYSVRGHWRDAERHFRTAAEIKAATDAAIAGVARGNLAITYLALGDAAKAEVMLREELARQTRMYGPDYREHSYLHMIVGRALVRQGKLDAAAAELEGALAHATKHHGPASGRVGGVLRIKAELARARGRFAVAKRIDEQVLAIFQKLGAQSARERTEVHLPLALDHLGLGAPARALAHAEQALAAAEEAKITSFTGEARFAVARALWELGERARAGELAKRARAELEPTGMAPVLAEIDAWLAARELPAP